MALLQHVERFIKERALLRLGDTVVVGVSGGPDSLCLLDVLTELAVAGGWQLTLHVACLDHGLRPEAAAEVEAVRREAAARGWAFHSQAADTRAHVAAHRLTLEEAARDLRYRFLAGVAASVGASTIAVAHTADDQAETVLMHFLRGSGLAGLRGMLPKTAVGGWLSAANRQPPVLPGGQPPALTLVRPLLTTTRAQVEAYCVERGLRPVQDPTNRDITFFRNRLRHELLPQLETYNPNLRAVLARTAEVMAGEYDLLQPVLEALWSRNAQADADQVAFDRARWRMLTLAEQRALLRRAIHHLRPELRDVDFSPVETAVRFSHTAQSGRACDLFAGLCLAVESEKLIVRPWRLESSTPDDLPLLTREGRVAHGWRFDAVEGTWPRETIQNPSSSWRVYVDADRLSGPLLIRAPRPGDRFQPLGLAGHTTKLSDFLINRKVPRAWRARWPMVVSDEAIVWVAGLRLDERFRVTPETRRVMRLEFIKTEGG